MEKTLTPDFVINYVQEKIESVSKDILENTVRWTYELRIEDGLKLLKRQYSRLSETQRSEYENLIKEFNDYRKRKL